MSKKRPTAYDKFLASKAVRAQDRGIQFDGALNPRMKDFQKAIAQWALRKGQSAVFAGTGLGKTFMQLEWGRVVCEHVATLGRLGHVLVIAPLAVAQQTVEQADFFGIPNVNRVYEQAGVAPGISVTNYDRFEDFDMTKFDAVVLDESSILKATDGATKKLLIERCANVPYKLCCTATPAPNDHVELGNHAEFLGIMTAVEMLSTWFCHDGGETSKWRLKKHAAKDFWRWVSTWAVSVEMPSDLGFSDEGYVLPALHIHEIEVDVDETQASEGMLFRSADLSATGLHKEMRMTAESRAQALHDLVTADKDQSPWLLWCNTDYEADAIKGLLANVVEIRGPEKATAKEKKLIDFAHGRVQELSTKPKIAGWGMNFQVCWRMVFVGLSYSYEQMFQAIRRCWRFGQTHEVHVYIIRARTEGRVWESLQRKEAEAAKMRKAMVAAMRETQLDGAADKKEIYTPRNAHGKGWALHLGDAIEVLRDMPDKTADYMIFSPPFASLYTYSASDRDMGNSLTYEQFEEHYRFLTKEMFRVLKPGRLLSFHCMNLPLTKERDGEIGIRDFRGNLVKIHQQDGFIFHSEVCIWKDPVTAMQRTKAIGLLYKQLRKDSALSRQGIPDYLVTMRKPGVNAIPIAHVAPPDGTTFKHARNVPSNEFPVERWQNYASPVWMDINPSDTLQKESAREHEDERHICPLQLEVIRRGIELWTNPGDVVLSPFAGIGSEGHVAIQAGRQFIGVELKESYFEQARKNLIEAERCQTTMFDEVEEPVA